MSSCYGKLLRLAIFGQSHSAAIGLSLDGLPAGERVDLAELQAFLDRRAPGRNAWSTARKESDVPEFLSGLVDGVTCGAPLSAILRNSDTRSQDYAAVRALPRPSHADYTAQVKYGGHQDVAGGGHFSGRLTAPLCVAGGICMQILARRGIEIGARIVRIGGVTAPGFDPVAVDAEQLRAARREPLPASMQAEIAAAKAEGDSVGGVIECAVTGLPAGLGEPMFDGMENRIAAIVFGIPAIRGVEFGTGFAAAAMRGSRHNDPYCFRDGSVATVTNHHGGVLGGITSGMPLLFRVAVKPTPSIGQAQQSVSLEQGCEAMLTITGRHDPCIVPRAVPVVEAAAAVAITDAMLEYGLQLSKDCIEREGEQI